MTYIDIQINLKGFDIFMIYSTKQEYNMFHFFSSSPWFVQNTYILHMEPIYFRISLFQSILYFLVVTINKFFLPLSLVIHDAFNYKIMEFYAQMFVLII